MTYDPDKVETLIKAVDAVLDRSFDADADANLKAARRDLDPKPEAPERFWLNAYDGDSMVIHRSREGAVNSANTSSIQVAIEYVRADLTARPVKGGVTGWFWTPDHTGEQGYHLTGGKYEGAVFLRECEPE